MNLPKFSEYNSDEAEAFGRAFVAIFNKHTDELKNANDTEQWTEAVFDIFAESIGRDDVVLDVRRSKRSNERYEALFHPGLRAIAGPGSLRRSHSHESLVDLSHYRFRSYSDYGSEEYWKQAFAPQAEPEALLVLESESGCASRGDYSSTNIKRIGDDASKLFSIAARMKVVVFASNGDEERDEVLKLAGLIAKSDYTRTHGNSKPVWLWLDLPWTDWSKYGPSAWLANAGEEGRVIS